MSIVKGGNLRTKVIRINGRVDDTFWYKTKPFQRISPISWEGKTDTVPRQLYRYFIGEPPPRTAKTCLGAGRCCNPWHMTAVELPTTPTLPPPSPTISVDQEIRELAQEICKHWVRHPQALVDELSTEFGLDYSPAEILQATRMAAIDMDGCPPGIRRTLLDALSTSPPDPTQGPIP